MKDRKHEYLTQRRTRRLPGYDYSQPGVYFISIVTENRECLFGIIVDVKMILNEIGEIVREEWLKSEHLRREINLDYWVIMPNHVHGIIFINDYFHCQKERTNEIEPQVAQKSVLYRKPKSLSTFISGFKSAVSRRINQMRGSIGGSIWQYNYHEHIIRDEKDLNIRRQYILENPARWEEDRLNPGK